MNKTNYTSWQRLESVIQRANMSINYFGRHIGLVRSEALYQIKSGQHGISQALARRIVEKFPEVSMGWLLTGEGDMLVKQSQCRTIPFYEGDISRGVQHLMSAGYRHMIDMPLLEECDLAYRSVDEAMNPEIMVGTIVFLKKTGLNTIISGGLYVIVCANYVILRRVRINEGEQGRSLQLEAANPAYDDFIIHDQQVLEIYRVVGCMKLY